MLHEPTMDEFTSTLLSYKSAEYRELVDRDDDIDMLVGIAKQIIQVHTVTLREDIKQQGLDNFLSAMLTYAPHPEGQRYVAVVLQIAHKHGPEAVVKVARTWRGLFFESQLSVYMKLRVSDIP